MSANSLEREACLPFDSIFFQDQVDQLIERTIPSFNRMIKKYVYFNFFFISIIAGETILLTFYFTSLIHDSLLAAALAMIFFTVSSYFILKAYTLSRRPEHFYKIRDQFCEDLKSLIDFSQDIPEHHLALATAYSNFSTALEGIEYTYYKPPRFLEFLAPTMETFSFYWHWHDIFTLRELMLMESVEEHIKLVTFEPTDLEVHAALANAYVLLSSLYTSPQSIDKQEEEQWSPPEKVQEQMKRKFHQTAERAKQEFMILNDFAPDDPWVHLQLAYSYHDLGMLEKEIDEYERVLRLCPDDKDILFKLGVLYFRQGANAKGLQVYEELKSTNFHRAQELINHYGDYKINT